MHVCECSGKHSSRRFKEEQGLITKSTVSRTLNPAVKWRHASHTRVMHGVTHQENKHVSNKGKPWSQTYETEGSMTLK